MRPIVESRKQPRQCRRPIAADQLPAIGCLAIDAPFARPERRGSAVTAARSTDGTPRRRMPRSPNWRMSCWLMSGGQCPRWRIVGLFDTMGGEIVPGGRLDLTPTGRFAAARAFHLVPAIPPARRRLSRMIKVSLLGLMALLPGACAFEDSRIAHDARTRLMGMAEVDLQSCLGVPDQHSTFGTTNILTYYATSTSSDTWSIPAVGGFAFSNGAYCHATFQLKDGHVTQLLYSGEKNATLAPDAYCAPIVRTCLEHLASTQPAAGATPALASPTSGISPTSAAPMVGPSPTSAAPTAGAAPVPPAGSSPPAPAPARQ
jgi:hypothetical protein